MQANFATVVEQAHKLSSIEKTELKCLLEKYLIEERREEIYQNYLSSQRENSYEFSSDINLLKEMLDSFGKR
ncbi:MAG: hypothetical protein ABFS56_06530 [Pseudomonadota bacterium]